MITTWKLSVVEDKQLHETSNVVPLGAVSLQQRGIGSQARHNIAATVGLKIARMQRNHTNPSSTLDRSTLC